MKVAVILPVLKSDYLANTVVDGLIDLQSEQSDLDLVVTTKYPSPIDLSKYERNEDAFISYANSSDLVILCWGKGSANFNLAEKIGMWSKTVFVDGSELGKNNRFDAKILDEVENGVYKGNGAIDLNMLSKCKLYFRRERPYIKNIIPFPFGIERRYRLHYDKNIKRDIDFTCIFGQDEYPILRRQVQQYLKEFCKNNNLVCKTDKTSGFNFDDNSKRAGRNEFYEILSRTKVGISIGGGGFDTARFWEILASGAHLMTEKISIYNEGDNKFKYRNITEFTSLEDFKIKLDEIARRINDVVPNDAEYQSIINDHSTKARVRELLKSFNNAQ